MWDGTALLIALPILPNIGFAVLGLSWGAPVKFDVQGQFSLVGSSAESGSFGLAEIGDVWGNGAVAGALSLGVVCALTLGVWAARRSADRREQLLAAGFSLGLVLLFTGVSGVSAKFAGGLAATGRPGHVGVRTERSGRAAVRPAVGGRRRSWARCAVAGGAAGTGPAAPTAPPMPPAYGPGAGYAAPAALGAPRGPAGRPGRAPEPRRTGSPLHRRGQRRPLRTPSNPTPCTSAPHRGLWRPSAPGAPPAAPARGPRGRAEAQGPHLDRHPHRRVRDRRRRDRRSPAPEEEQRRLRPGDRTSRLPPRSHPPRKQDQQNQQPSPSATPSTSPSQSQSPSRPPRRAAQPSPRASCSSRTPPDSPSA